MITKELIELLKQFPDDLEIVKKRTLEDGRYTHEFYEECDVKATIGKNLQRWGEPKDGLLLSLRRRKE